MFSVEVKGQEKLEAGLKGVANDLSDLRKIDRPLTDKLFSIVREQFATQGARSGSRWPARSESYLKAITRGNRGGFRSVGEPLRATDALFLATTTRGAPNSVYEVSQDEITVGTKLPYARAHQFGLGRMPQRKIYDLTDRDLKDLAKVAGDAYRKPIEDRGFDYKEGTGEIPF